jgi:hypothetical protein
LTLDAGPVTDAAGSPVSGTVLVLSPVEVASLAPGASVPVSVTLSLTPGLAAGRYRAVVEAALGGATAAKAAVTFEVAEIPVLSVEIVAGPDSVVQGDPDQFTVEVRDAGGTTVAAPVAWKIVPFGAGLIDGTGRLVGYNPGSVKVVAESMGAADTAALVITARSIPTGSFTLVARRDLSGRWTSDHWEFGDAAYVGTWRCRTAACRAGILVWDISDPSNPVLTDSLLVSAATVNDVKIRDDGALGVLTHEGSTGGAITLFDLADPVHPAVITTYQPPELAPGVHNAWVEGDYVYLVVDGAFASAGLKVVKITDPAAPAVVADFYAGSSFLHDVYVRDGLAFLSHWDAGLVILDVGNGIAGGSPESPVEVSRFVFPFPYAVHNAWYWPAAGYVFVGDEFNEPGRGFVRILDVSDVRNPREVASFRVSGAAPHNFWVDEPRAIAYFGWYESGVQAVDVSGELLGALDRQGRRIAQSRYAGTGDCFTGGTCTWAPQLHGGRIYVSDLDSGLAILEPGF